MNKIYKLKRNWAIVDRYPDYYQMALEDLTKILLLINEGRITPVIKPDIMMALGKLEKVDIDSEVIYNAD